MSTLQKRPLSQTVIEIWTTIAIVLASSFLPRPALIICTLNATILNGYRPRKAFKCLMTRC